jgi:putative membrane protein
VDVTDLPALNATLNAAAGTVLILAFLQIKKRRIEAHRRLMLTAFALSVMFLISYVIYHAQAGSRPFPGTGLARIVYFSILIPHVVLAALVVPLAIVTLRRGLVRDDQAHRKIARVTFPIWLFVSASGVVVYLMLYQLY